MIILYSLLVYYYVSEINFLSINVVFNTIVSATNIIIILITTSRRDRTYNNIKMYLKSLRRSSLKNNNIILLAT